MRTNIHVSGKALRVIAAATAAGCGFSSIKVLAAPYASQVSEAAGVVTFTLNEGDDVFSPKANVTIIRDGVPEPLGPLAIGSHTFNRSGATNYSIVVTQTAPTGFTTQTGLTSGVTNTSDGSPQSIPLQISSDNNIRNSFNSPRGVTINRNPANGADFGLVYVANSGGGTTGGFPTPARTLGDGIYINGADGSDPLAQGNTALTGSLDFAGGGTSSPMRVALDTDGFLYISDWSDPRGTVYRTDAHVTSGVQLLAGNGSGPPIAPTPALTHGSIIGLAVTGTVAAGNLTIYTIDEDLTPVAPTAAQLNGAWRYDIGAGTVVNNSTLPVQLNGNYGQIDFVSQTMGLARTNNGNLLITNRRDDGLQGGLFTLAPNGTALYNSLTDAINRNIDGNTGLDGIQDPFRQSFEVAASPDGKFMAIVRNDSTSWVIPLINGIPDMPNRTLVQTFDPLNFGRDIDFDAADNLYVVSSGNAAMRIFSPGLVTQATTNSNGTFQVKNLPEWNVTGSGSISDSGNWLLNYLPNGKSQVAVFGQSTSGAATINVDQPFTLGSIYLDSSNKYTIAGTATLTMDSYGEPRINALNGSHDITAPLLLNGNTQFNVAHAGDTLNVTSISLGAATVAIAKSGDGLMVTPNIRAGGLAVYGGTLRTPTNGGTSVVNSLKFGAIGRSMATTVAQPGTLDLTNNSLIVDYDPSTASPLANIRDFIKGGFNNGAWTGSGITSSTAAALAAALHKTAIGYAEASSILGGAGGTFAGQTVDGSAVVTRYTLYGDSNLDGAVNTADFNQLAANFNGSSKFWFDGDYNFDGTVNALDFNMLASNFGSPIPAPALGSLVPEPASLTLLVAGAAALGLRRRRF